jgi:hypothetical protein
MTRVDFVHFFRSVLIEYFFLSCFMIFLFFYFFIDLDRKFDKLTQVNSVYFLGSLFN